MLNELKLENFKCYKNQTVPLKKINLITGINSSGKSTIIQALKLFSISNSSLLNLKEDKSWNFIGFKNLLNNSSDSEGFKITLNNELKKFNEFFYNRTPINNYCKVECDRNTEHLETVFVKADRYMTTTHQLEGGDINKGYIPINGNPYFAEYLHANSNALNEENLTERLSSLMKKIGLIDTNIVINKLFDSYQILIDDSYVDHVGTGIRYTLPLLLTLLSNHGSTICIENPELHLHPSAQVKLVKMIIELAEKNNNQIIMETHSDHVLNTLRVLVKQSELNMDDVEILFLQAKANINSIHIDEDGTLDKNLLGFFDEYENQLLALI